MDCKLDHQLVFVHFSKCYWYWLFGIVIGILVLVFWFGTSCMRTWHGYGLSIGLSGPLFVHFLHQGMCPMLHYIRLYYITLHQVTYIGLHSLHRRNVPYATLHQVTLIMIHFLTKEGALCPKSLHYTKLHCATFLTPRHVPYAAPSAFGSARSPPWLLVRDQMPLGLDWSLCYWPACVWLGLSTFSL